MAPASGMQGGDASMLQALPRACESLCYLPILANWVIYALFVAQCCTEGSRGSRVGGWWMVAGCGATRASAADMQRSLWQSGIARRLKSR